MGSIDSCARALETIKHVFWVVGEGGKRGGRRFAYTRTHESGRGNSDAYLQIAKFIEKVNLAICKVHVFPKT